MNCQALTNESMPKLKWETWENWQGGADYPMQCTMDEIHSPRLTMV